MLESGVINLKLHIYFLMDKQKKIRQDVDNLLNLHDSTETEIERLETELWWANFINFCNTPCWRFKC